LAIIRKYKARVESLSNHLSSIFTMTLSSEKKFKYLPGQFLHLALDEYDGVGQWPESRCFSMQTSPNERFLKITFVVKGNYTKRMANELHEGKEVWLKLPYGDIFQRGHDKKNCVFIAGGTGLTPFLSLFTDSSFGVYIKPVLFAGFRNAGYNIFKQDLIRAKGINQEFEINYIYQDKKGMLDIEEIYETNPNATFFISGSPIMIKNFKNSLIIHNVIEERIITDDWE